MQNAVAGFRIGAPEPSDHKMYVGFGHSWEYSTKEDIPVYHRYLGMKVIAKESGVYKEYQLQGGTADENWVQTNVSATLSIITGGAAEMDSGRIKILKQFFHRPSESTPATGNIAPDFDDGNVALMNVSGTKVLDAPLNAQNGVEVTLFFNFTGNGSINPDPTYYPNLSLFEGLAGGKIVVRGIYIDGKFYAWKTNQYGIVVQGKWGISLDQGLTALEINSGTSFSDFTPDHIEINFAMSEDDYPWFYAPLPHVYNFYKDVADWTPISNTFNIIDFTDHSSGLNGYAYILRYPTTAGTIQFKK